jgi:hypothetical protein
MSSFEEKFTKEEIAAMEAAEKRYLGHRRAENTYTQIRINPLLKLVDLHTACTDKHSPLYQELRKRYVECSPWLSGPNNPAELALYYLTTQDVMNLLKCNRRTALDYRQALRDIYRDFAQ